MAITNYTELKAAITSWSARRDGNLFIDDFIRLAELDMYNNPDKSLRLKGIETRSTASMSITSRYLALPDGFRSARSIRIDQTDICDEIEFRTPEQLRRRDGTGQPYFFAVTSQIEFDVVPDIAYTVEVNYIKEPDGITAANPTNEVLTSNPDIYLYGALSKVFIKAKDIETAVMYKGLFDSAVKGANKAAEDSRYGPNMASIPDTFTP